MSLGNDRLARSKFRRYLMNRCHLKYSSAATYVWSLNTLSKYLKDIGAIYGSLYDIKNVHQLLNLKTVLSESYVFKIVNDKCHGNLTPSLRHYYDFMVSDVSSDHRSDHHTRVSFQRV